MVFKYPWTGDQRTVRRFLLFPTKINGFIYWLQWVTIHQSYNTRRWNAWCNDWVEED